MIQKILCPGCAESALKMHFTKNYPTGQPQLTKYAGEYAKLTWGTAQSSFFCDFCGQDINPMTKCAAFSIWTEKNPFISGWEEFYIDPLSPDAVAVACQVKKRMGVTP